MYEREEVNDEIQGLAAQEMAKIKHMVKSLFHCHHHVITSVHFVILRVHRILADYIKNWLCLYFS